MRLAPLVMGKQFLRLFSIDKLTGIFNFGHLKNEADKRTKNKLSFFHRAKKMTSHKQEQSKSHNPPDKQNLHCTCFLRPALTILFILLFTFSFSQISKIDSLLTLLKTDKEDTNKVNHLISICNEYRVKGEYDRGLQYGNSALELAIVIESKTMQPTIKQTAQKDIAIAYRIISIIYANLSNNSKSFENLLASQKIIEKLGDKQSIGAAHQGIGDFYYSIGNYSETLNNYFAALKIFEELGDKGSIAILYNNIGLVYKEQGNYPKALENFNASLKIDKEQHNKQGIAIEYINIGDIYKKQAEYQINPVNKGQLHDEAFENYFAALKIFEETKDRDGIAMGCNNIGELFVLRKKFSEAKEYLNKGLIYSKEIGAKDRIQFIYHILSLCDSAAGNFKMAYEYHQLYSQYKDSIFNEESSKQIAEMQTKYETEKKELQIENLNKDNAIKETEIKKQNFQKLAFAGGFCLMLILAFVIFSGYRQKQKANEIISTQKSEVEKQKEIVDEKNKSLEVAYKHIEEKNHEILDSIRYAKRIQEAILPPQKLVKEYLANSFILYKPKDIVAGDFYWMEVIGDNILFAACDCTGHGVPGAFVSIVGHNALNRAVKEFGLTEPAKILDKANELVEDTFSKSETDIKDGMDIALCKLTMTNNKWTIEYAGANNSIYLIRDKALNEIKADKQPIGKYAMRKSFTNNSFELQPNDTIYAFSDGYADQFGGPKGKKFKYSQFENLIVSIQDKSMTEQREILNETIDKWRGELAQIDDICIIGVRV